MTCKRVGCFADSLRWGAETADISAIFDTISDLFNNEMLQKQTKLNATEASVRHATKALADKRQQVARAQSVLTEVEQVGQRSENVRKAMEGISPSDWTGFSSSSTEPSAPPAFRAPGAGSSPVHARNGTTNSSSGEDIGLPERGAEGSLTQLRRIAMWEDRISSLLESRIQALQGESAEKAVKYRRLVGLCTKVPVDKVDGVGRFPLRPFFSFLNDTYTVMRNADEQMLDGLVAAIESDGQSIDLSRISSFMSRMKEQAA